MVRGRRSRALLGLGLALASACGLAEKDPPPINSTGPDDDGSASVTDTADSGTDGNCGGMSCTGHGACVEDEDGAFECVCDEGYIYDAEAGGCAVDETCIEIRYLEDRCRQVFDGAPAVTLFFGVDFCAGTAVLPADIDRLGLEFLVLEADVDIEENVESHKEFVDKGVESYVTLAIDVSESVAMSGDVQALVGELHAFVDTLAPAMGEPPVYVSIQVFGAEVAEHLPFTRDLTAVNAALAEIENDFVSVSNKAGGGAGTDLYDAVEIGLARTDRARKLRDAATWGGVLTTGTLVVVTDGINSTGGDLDTAQLDKTTNQVISIGISNDVDDVTLADIGRDGSFLAPTVDEWTTAFAEIAQRVDQYPLRSYLLGYCSSLNEGEPEVEVRVRYIDDGTIASENGAACKFYPAYFGSDLEDTCGEGFFTSECGDEPRCGGITACGACSSDECCTGSTCESPKTATALEISCDEQDDLCAGDGQICEMEMGVCVDPSGVGDACAAGCEPGVGYCDEKTTQCAATVPLGEACTAPEQCETLHCDYEDPDLPTASKECLPKVEMFGPCGDDVAFCEIGSYCKGSTCVPELIDLDACSSGAECRRGQCTEIEGSGKLCLGEPACFWSWDQKYPD